MPKNNKISEIRLNNLNETEIDLPTTSVVDMYLLLGDITMNSDLTFSVVGSPTIGMEYVFSFPANVTLGTNTFTVLGRNLTAIECSNSTLIKAIYNGTTWDVYVF